MTDRSPNRLILVTGATGYVGGRLVEQLEGRGESVRCLARRPEALEGRVDERTEITAGDALDPDSLAPALAGVHTAYYLIHLMGAGDEFEAQDRSAAQNFARAATAAGVQRIIYLGGLGDPEEELSPHLRSRHEVGRILATSDAEVLELRASIVLGSGSLSFEMVRALTERLPVMVTPRWVGVKAQPIAIRDLLDYLLAALELPPGGDRVLEIGGADVVSYKDLMREYARQRGLSRIMIPVPVLTPKLSSLWLALVTPLYATIGRKLIESIQHPTVVHDDTARRLFDIEPMGVEAAIAEALRNEDRKIAATRWSDALSAGGSPPRWGGVRFHNRIVDARQRRVPVGPERAFRPIRRIGGATGWYFANILWRLRGTLDLLVGGVGLRRGRRDPEHPHVGDTLDFWRVEAYEPDRRLLLQAEMKVPGRAWLEFEVESENGGSVIRQSAVFDPAGLLGLAYWYALFPLHGLIFRGMLRNIARAAVRPVVGSPTVASPES